MQNTTSTLPCTPQVIVRAVTAMFAGSDLHAKQIESVAHAILGAMATPSAGVASLGRAASAIRLKHAKHGIKQVDRMLSNDKIDDLDLARAHVAFVVGQRNSIVVTMDWTEYGLHGQNRLAINLVTRHGRRSAYSTGGGQDQGEGGASRREPGNDLQPVQRSGSKPSCVAESSMIPALPLLRTPKCGMSSYAAGQVPSSLVRGSALFKMLDLEKGRAQDG